MSDTLDTSEKLARWIWCQYVGIPIAEPYDEEYTKLFEKVEALQRLWFTKGLTEARSQYSIPMVDRATGRTIPDLTKREHVCEYQGVVRVQP